MTIDPGYFEKDSSNQSKSIIEGWPAPSLLTTRNTWLNLLTSISEFKIDTAFSHVFHLQIHKRNQAISKLAELTKSDAFTSQFQEDVIIPIAQATLSDPANKENNYLNEAAMDLISNSLEKLSWKRFLSYAQRFISLAVQLSEKSAESSGFNRKQHQFTARLISNLTIRVLKNRDFSENLEDTSNLLLPNLMKTLAEKSRMSKIDQVTGRDIVEENYRRLSEKLPLAVATFELAKQIENNTFQDQILLKIVGILRSKAIDVRQLGLRTLEKLIQPENFEFILGSITSILNPKGFQRHVKINAINTLLRTEQMQDVNLDDYFRILQPSLEMALFEKEVEEQKQIGTILSKTPEARGRSKAFNIGQILKKINNRISKKSKSFLFSCNLELLGERLSIGGTNWFSLISWLKSKLTSSHKPEEFKKIKSCFEALTNGVKENKTDEKVVISLFFTEISNSVEVQGVSSKYLY